MPGSCRPYEKKARSISECRQIALYKNNVLNRPKSAEIYFAALKLENTGEASAPPMFLNTCFLGAVD